MYFQSIKLSNYLSMGSSDSTLIIEPKITTIIGKNESGKSNIIKGINSFYFFSSNNSIFNKNNINRQCKNNEKIEFTINLKASPSDTKIGIDNDTKVIINENGTLAYGGIVDAYKKLVIESVNSLYELLKESPLKINDSNDASLNKHNKEILSDVDNHIAISQVDSAINYLRTKIKQSQLKNNDDINNILLEIDEQWKLIKSSFPYVFYRDDRKVLNNIYKLEDATNELKSSNRSSTSLLSDLVDIIDIKRDDFIDAIKSGNELYKTSLREEINDKIDEQINTKFNEFYNVEKVSLKAHFNNNAVTFSIKTNKGATLDLSERSNGLRWYLNTFIDILSNNLPSRNVLFLFDEPATSLHINAQKEVLTLFSNLCEKGNQIVYSTHFPSMIDVNSDGIHRIRAVFKNEQGISIICKTAYDNRITEIDQQDVYAPIRVALGMSLQTEFFLSRQKINVICEGVSDYIYLKTFSGLLKYDCFNFIPSVGATDSIKIHNILFGWGYNSISLFDYDKEGVEKGGLAMEKTQIFKFGQDFIYVKDVSQEDISAKSYSKNAYTIEDCVGRDTLNKFIEDNNLPENFNKNNKTLLSKQYCDYITYNFNPDDENAKRFKELFERLRSII